MVRPLLLALVVTTAAGCAWGVGVDGIPRSSPGRRPPPPPEPSPMTYDEAVQLGSGYARSRGFEYRLDRAQLEGHRAWKLRFDVRTREARGELELAYDAYSRALLKADEKLRPDHGRGDDHDDDDRHHDNGRHRGRDKHGD
jgi:hypothetical protein